MNMWEYKCETVFCLPKDIEDKMNEFGKYGWEIFALQEFPSMSEFKRYELVMKKEVKESEVQLDLKPETKLEYSGKYLYIDADGNMRHKWRDTLKPEGDTVLKQPYILPGVYDGLWSAYSLEVIFDNKKRSDPIETRDGVRGINCPVTVIVMNDGTVHVE